MSPVTSTRKLIPTHLGITWLFLLQCQSKKYGGLSCTQISSGQCKSWWDQGTRFTRRYHTSWLAVFGLASGLSNHCKSFVSQKQFEWLWFLTTLVIVLVRPRLLSPRGTLENVVLLSRISMWFSSAYYSCAGVNLYMSLYIVNCRAYDALIRREFGFPLSGNKNS